MVVRITPVHLRRGKETVAENGTSVDCAGSSHLRGGGSEQ